MIIEQQRLQQKLAEETDMRARFQKAASDGQAQISDLEAATQSLQKQARAQLTGVSLFLVTPAVAVFNPDYCS